MMAEWRKIRKKRFFHPSPLLPCGYFVFLLRCVGMNSKSALAFSNRAMAYLKV